MVLISSMDGYPENLPSHQDLVPGNGTSSLTSPAGGSGSLSGLYDEVMIDPSTLTVRNSSPGLIGIFEKSDGFPTPLIDFAGTSTDQFSMASTFRDMDDLLVPDPLGEESSNHPLKTIEDFVAKTMAKKVAGRRNIRNLKSLKELNPETRRALEEETKRISEMEHEAGINVPIAEAIPDVEILTVDLNDCQPSGSRLQHVVSVEDSHEIIALPSPRPSGDIVFVESKERYPSISSFHCDDTENKPDENGKIVINVGRMKREPCICVADHLVPHLRPHQIGGIRFMYATLIESIGKFTNGPGNGGVLAHSMGLGKTLQVITFLNAIFQYTPVKTVLIVAPLNTMAHWMAEFNKWLPLEDRHEKMKLFCIRDQKAISRNAIIKSWATDGGVLLIGYEKIRALADVGGTRAGRRPGGKAKKRKRSENVKDAPLPNDNVENVDDSQIEAAKLVLEAGQIVICDEGHRIKSAEAAITRVLKDVKSRRRMILTGYPLQNNLMEYWCMIDFVRPFLLGNETEFANLFKNPIENGQCADSSDHDRRIMRQRTYILQRTLCRIVQRRDSKPLIAELPKKREFAIIFRQTPSQGSLYRSLFEELTRHRETFNCVALYTTFRNITHHPAIFFAHLKKLSESVSEGSGQQEVNGPIRQLLIDLVKQGKWERFLANLGTFKFDEIHSGKILFLKHLVLEAVVKRKEKIIIFSQSIDVLEYLQEYLPTLLPRVGGEEKREFPITFRIDGSTSSSERERLINLFNDESHETRMFLISTEAGGIGINLTGGCRVVLLDVSWNPSKDIQAISRIYRYGQNRISTIYRLVGDGSMERCVFDRQIHKQFLFKRVVDDKSPMLAINQTDLGSLFSVDGLTTSADWHKVCEEPFPEEAKADEILGSLEGSRTFRQYLSMAPIVMDSILEADDTAQLSEFERREAETSFMREKRPETSSMRRPLPASSTRGSSYMTGPSFQRISAPVAVRPFPLAHGSRSGIPKAIQIPLDAAIRDPVLLMECKSRILKREDFGEIIQQYGTMTRMRISKHLIPDSQGNPSETYVLQPPGAVFSFVFKSDGSVWQMMHAAPDPPRTAVAVPEISVQASPVDLHNA